jgi:hypothetical protein
VAEDGEQLVDRESIANAFIYEFARNSRQFEVLIRQRATPVFRMRANIPDAREGDSGRK